ncbi:MAG: hypothetical protein AAFQ15_02960 [Pseudomonadota bacterium]
MSLRFIILLGAMAAGGVVGSVILENGGATGAADQSATDTWRQPTPPINYSNSSDRFLTALSSGRLFPNTVARSASIGNDPESVLEENSGPTIFPTLISVSRRDGTFIATVAFDNGQQAFVEKGDLLVDDWTVAELSSDALVAQLGSDYINIPLFLTD